MFQIYVLFIVLIATLALFIWGKWRYDIVAAIALSALFIFGIVPASETFIGFSNPAVITVACVMIITQAISQTGIIDQTISRIMPTTSSPIFHIGMLSLIAAILSAFMNNVGALALMMPIAIQTALKHKHSPSLFLMPIAFSSILGGLMTAIGTPPNLLISAYRQQVTGHAFAMFDFSLVGFWVALSSIIFIALIGWRLLPKHRISPARDEELFQIQAYISEVIVPKDSPLIGKSRTELEALINGEVNIIGLIRGKIKHLVMPTHETFKAGDVLIIEASQEDLQDFLKMSGLELVGGEIISADKLRSDQIGLMEAVVTQNARIEGRSWQRVKVRSRMHINLIGISRQGKAFKNRLNHVNLRAGDVVLLQGELDILKDGAINLGFLPLSRRIFRSRMSQSGLTALGIFAITIILSSLQILPVHIAFAMAVLVLTLVNIIPVRQLYNQIDWSIIVLLGVMIPIGNAMQSTGATGLIANFLVSFADASSPAIIITLLLIVSMTLSDLINNAATAVIMAPMAVSIAQILNISIDPLLMAVAIGSSSSFLTPIGHQNNTLVMGPGGYKFFDYMRLGLPIEIIVLIVSVPSILWFWY